VFPERVLPRRDARGSAAQPAQLRDVFVLDLECRQALRQRILVVLGIGPRSRYGSDVRNRTHRSNPEQGNEFFQCAGGVTDRVKGELHSPPLLAYTLRRAALTPPQA